MSNFGALRQQAEVLLEKLTSGKRFLLSDVQGRLHQASQDNPSDGVIQAVAHVVERLHSKDPEGIISQADLENIYQELVGLNASGTKFREALGDLLITETPKFSSANEDYIAGLRDDPVDSVDYAADIQVKNDFDYLFGPQTNSYNPQLAADAKDKVAKELVSLGFSKNRVRLAGGNSRFLVFAADLDTNRGAVRVYIPAEASGETFPSIFVAGSRFDNLTSKNLHSYLEEAALRNIRPVEVSKVLATLDAATGNMTKYASDQDFQQVVSKLPEIGDVSGHGVFGDLPDPKNDIGSVEIPATPVPEALKMIASDVEEGVLEASVGCPQATVRLAKRMLSAEFSSMGFPNTQLRVAEPTNDGFICEATLNTPDGKVKIEVPIETQGDIPLMPSVFAQNDFVAELNQKNLNDFTTKNADKSMSVLRYDSPLNEMSIAELRNMITRSASCGDYPACEEALGVIACRFDGNTYRAAVADYQTMLTRMTQAEESVSQSYDDSDQFVKTPNSIYPIHKKLGRPAHDLIRDESGQYHLKTTYNSRKNLEEESAFFSTAKVLVGE